MALSAQGYLTQLDKANGQPAQVAINMGWVDKLVTRDDFREEMKQLLPEDKKHHSFRQVNFNDYLALIKQPSLPLGDQNVGVIVAKGKILNGYQQPGEIGGESTAAAAAQGQI